MAISSALGSSALLPAGLGFRNVLINGDFGIWQRGTSFSITTGVPYTADRWCVTAGGTASYSVSRQTSNLDGFQYCLRFQRASGNTNTSILYMSQPVETANSIPLANKQVTFSFYAKAGANFSASSSALNVRIVTGTGTDGNYLSATLAGQAIRLDTTATLSTSWQRFTYTVFIPSGTNQVQPVLFYTPSGTAGTNDFYEITGVQLEANTQPTPFEQIPVGVELLLCQRYYMRWNTLAAYGRLGTGIAVSSSAAEYLLPYNVTPRNRLGTFSVGGSLQHSDGAAASAIFVLSRLDIVCSEVFYVVHGTSSGLAQYRPMYIEGSNSTGAFVASDMEL